MGKEGLSKTEKFSVFGFSMGTVHAMAMAQHFGPQGRLRCMGIRAPFVPLCVSKKHKLPNGQISFPTTEALQRGSFYAWQVRGFFWLFSKLLISSRRAYAFISGKFKTDHTRLNQYMFDTMNRSLYNGYYGSLAVMYMAAFDVALDKVFIDVDLIRSLIESGKIERSLLWYGEDDVDCPPPMASGWQRWASETNVSRTHFRCVY